MKKILLSLLLAAGVLTSCDMQKDLPGTLNGDDAIQNVLDASRYRNVIYTGLRGFTSSSFFTNPEIQMDKFLATTLCGNRGLVFASGDIYASTGEVSTWYATLYGQIASINYFLEKVEPLLAACEDQKDKAAYERYVAEAKFARGYYCACLLDRFAPAYSAEMAEAPGMGIAIVTKYEPTADRSKYPARSTQNASYTFIEQDLNDALDAFLELEKTNTDKTFTVEPMAIYLNSNVVKALQARVALLKQDYATAYAKAVEVINSKVYELATPDNYALMWTNDVSDEIIFEPFEVSPDEVSNSIGSRWLSIYPDRADYIPTFDCLLDYYDGDCRFEAFFAPNYLTIEGSQVPAYCFYKFPGNEALKIDPSQINLVNKPKPFRLSELYLIAAEAAQAGSLGDALTYYNEFCAARYDKWENETLTGTGLRDAIRAERTRELIGEGFRMSDLRRWGLPMERSGKFQGQLSVIEPYLWASTANMDYPVGDRRFTWPIPKSELEVNPQMAGQQNPGY